MNKLRPFKKGVDNLLNFETCVGMANMYDTEAETTSFVIQLCLYLRIIMFYSSQMEPFSPTLLSIGTAVATYISVRGTKRKSLSKSGACTAFTVGFLSIACGLRGFVLLIFYQIGTKATKYKKQVKLQRDGDVAKSSVRGPSQGMSIACLFDVYIYFIHD